MFVALRVKLFPVRLIAWSAALFLAAPGVRSAQTNPPAAATEANTELAGGNATVFDVSPKAFGFPVPGLDDESRAAFFIGHSFFLRNWVAGGPPATRAGLGPIFNARSCSACHPNDGRGRPPELGQPIVQVLMRISVPGTGAHHGPLPDPVYGGQIQSQAIPGVHPEADITASYAPLPGQFGDGETFSLRSPTYSVNNPGYGPLAATALLSPRVAPAMAGMGLLEAVPESELRAIVERQAREGNGVRGHPNSVWDIAAGKMAIGRFGWKAEQPTVFQQTATAFNEDMGLTTPLLPQENYTRTEAAVCELKLPSSQPEVSEKILHDVVFYARTLAVPGRRAMTDATVLHGQQLFQQTGCAACHVPTLHTGDSDIPQLAHQTIHPYTDLLLHDMGEGLSDHRPSFDATGNDWRTPPLWGIGLVSTVNNHTFFLHDGRGRNLTEAILWHGGEAQTAREQFRNLSKSDRDALLGFLNAL
jgi:CxxC motif-containing protein (DUF1111 family)